MSRCVKRIAAAVLVGLAAAAILSQAGRRAEPAVVNTFEGYRTYSEMSDGTWRCDGYAYAYRLEIRGRMNAAVSDCTFVYLSNAEEIPFDRAWKAAGLSSSTNDYFSKDEAVLVDWSAD